MPEQLLRKALYFSSAYTYAPLFNLRKTDFIGTAQKHQDYISFGIDNQLPTQLNKLAREVPIHRAILNSKTQYIIGKGLFSNNAEINRLIQNPNNINVDLTNVMRRVVYDYLTHGNGWLEIVTNAKKSFVYFYHSDASKIRIATENNQVIIHPDWEIYKGKNDENAVRISRYPDFSEGLDGMYHSIYQIKDYEPEFYHYGLCAYFAGLRSIIICGLTNIWNQARLERHFSAPGLLVIPGVNSEEDAKALDAEFQTRMGAGSQNAADLIIQYLADLGPGQPSQAAQYINFLQKEEGNWLALHEQAEVSLLSIHNWFRSLTPYKDDTGFDKGRIISDWEAAMASYIRPTQDLFIKHLMRVLRSFGFPDSDLDFVSEPPVAKINPFKFVWEVRRDASLDFDPNDPIQKQLVIQIRNTYGTSSDIEEIGKSDQPDKID